ncbi:YkvA family protein [Cesiribacter sp. SM1]|uniref:YkvA family protein n=1 Tax=Cesiribacter sp. SM1 TaxID=2861196 RepID=UPI001CD36AF2|nr:YkvA family protein [Cesiribacter sp. SM1]
MSRERHLEKLKASLRESQEILGELVAGTSRDAGKRLHKANKKLQRTYDDASTELEGYLEDASKDFRKQYAKTSKDVEQQFRNSRRELEKRAVVFKDEFNDRFEDTRAAAKAAKRSLGAGAIAMAAKADIPSRAANVAAFLAKTGLAAKAASTATKAAGFVAKTGLAAKAASLVANTDIKSRTANLLEGAATSFASARNKLNPDDRLIIQHESEGRRISKAGYFVRFSALAIIIISKRHKLMELGTQLYNKLKDSEGRASITQDARDQFDTMRRLMKAYANGQYREFPYRSLVKIVAAVIYFVSVADLIPDFIPILGLTDDLAILAWVYSSVKDDLQQFVDWEAAEEKRRSRLAKQSSGSQGSETSGGSTTSGSSTTTGSGIANVGNTAAADRTPSPNVTTSTGSDTGSKATVTTGTTSTTGSTGSATGGGSGSTGSSNDKGSTTGTTGTTGGTLGGVSDTGSRSAGNTSGSQGGNSKS